MVIIIKLFSTESIDDELTNECVYPVESMLMSFVMYAIHDHQGVKHVTNSGINIQKEETTILR